MNIKKLLKKNEYLYYIAYCIANIKSKKFRNRVLEIKTNPNQMRFKHNGLKNSGCLYYHIVVGDETKGFCSAIRDTLYYLAYAESLGLLPYIEYTKNMPYQENEPINGGSNSFEYFFRQPCVQERRILDESVAVVDCEAIHTEGIFTLRGINEPKSYYVNENDHIDICAQLYRKYFKLNEHVEKNFKNDIEMLIKAKTIGVHFRGTDFKVGYNGHPVAVKHQEHINEVKKLLETGEYQYVFLATEDGDVIDSFKKEFGEKLLMYDVVRGTGETNAYNMKSNRKHHHYLLAYEVLRDVYTLAHCDAFVTSVSGVGITSQIVKKSMGNEFESVSILDAGINKTKKTLQKRVY